MARSRSRCGPRRIGSANDAGTTDPTWDRIRATPPSAGAAWTTSRARESGGLMRDGAPGWARWLAVSVAVIVLDLASKALVSGTLSIGDVVRVAPFFNVILTHH